MAPSDHPNHSLAPILDGCASIVAPSDDHMLLHSRQSSVPYERRRCLPNTRIPNRGHVDRLPGVASLLRRYDTVPTSDPVMRHSSYQLQCPTSHTNSTFECWTPPRLAERPNSIASPASKLVPLTAALDANDGRFNGWSSNLDKYVPTTTNEILGNWTEDAKASAPVVLSPEPVRETSESRPKSSRYLREIDRRRILMRIAQGEKQSALAKEYHVSRAAICNLNKHRAEVLSRNHEHPLAKHPKRRMLAKLKRQDMMMGNQSCDSSDR